MFRSLTKSAPEHLSTCSVFRHVPKREKLNKERRNMCSDKDVPKLRHRELRGAERNTPHP